VSAEAERIVRAFLQAMTDGDVEAAALVVDAGVELSAPNTPTSSGFETLTQGWSRSYDHLDDLFSLESAEDEGDGIVALVRRELRWRTGSEPAVQRMSTIRYDVRDGRILRIAVLDRTPWVPV
jgi:hypothetical protein